MQLSYQSLNYVIARGTGKEKRLLRLNLCFLLKVNLSYYRLAADNWVDYVRSEGGSKNNYFCLLNLKPPEAISQIIRLLQLSLCFLLKINLFDHRLAADNILRPQRGGREN